ncbi:hypothetical protein GCM10020331_024060 [Ectobacillus funiculus]
MIFADVTWYQAYRVQLQLALKKSSKRLRKNAAVIVQAAKGVLERTPPELSADIIDRGVILTGGGALLHGIDMLLAEELKVPVLIAEDPMQCVGIGTGIMLDNIDRLPKRSLV